VVPTSRRRLMSSRERDLMVARRNSKSRGQRVDASSTTKKRNQITQQGGDEYRRLPGSVHGSNYGRGSGVPEPRQVVARGERWEQGIPESELNQQLAQTSKGPVTSSEPTVQAPHYNIQSLLPILQKDLNITWPELVQAISEHLAEINELSPELLYPWQNEPEQLYTITYWEDELETEEELRALLRHIDSAVTTLASIQRDNNESNVVHGHSAVQNREFRSSDSFKVRPDKKGKAPDGDKMRSVSDDEGTTFSSDNLSFSTRVQNRIQEIEERERHMAMNILDEVVEDFSGRDSGGSRGSGSQDVTEDTSFTEFITRRYIAEHMENRQDFLNTSAGAAADNTLQENET
ncbi:hypothetical protein HDU93_001065, partial [Gonapodya sp. JEL0774]